MLNDYIVYCYIIVNWKLYIIIIYCEMLQRRYEKFLTLNNIFNALSVSVNHFQLRKRKWMLWLMSWNQKVTSQAFFIDSHF